MPARREYTAAELAERLDVQREQARVRMARMRARNGARNGVRVTNTPLHARKDVRSPAPVTTTTPLSPPVPPRVTKGPTKSGEVIDRLRADGFRGSLSQKDHTAIKRSDLSPAEIVEAFGAVSRGEWDNPWLRANLSVEAVINRYSAFEALRRFPGVRAGGRAGEARKSKGTRILEHFGYGAE